MMQEDQNFGDITGKISNNTIKLDEQSLNIGSQTLKFMPNQMDMEYPQEEKQPGSLEENEVVVDGLYNNY